MTLASLIIKLGAAFIMIAGIAVVIRLALFVIIIVEPKVLRLFRCKYCGK